jgi:hypothetical protein
VEDDNVCAAGCELCRLGWIIFSSYSHFVFVFSHLAHGRAIDRNEKYYRLTKLNFDSRG